MAKYRCVNCKQMYEKTKSTATRLGLCSRACERAIADLTTAETITQAVDHLRAETPDADKKGLDK